ncbi:hypothetical protein FQN57_000688 [Myotisia sp. PD_48]|nr:hypothetical protein FQN57_000688 [Myotisia sp. PD_48]
MSALLILPTEIQQQIFCSLPDFQTLGNLAVAHPILQNAFTANRSSITYHVLRNCLPIALLPEAYATMTAVRYFASLPERKWGPKRPSKIQRKRILDEYFLNLEGEPLEHPSDPEVIKEMAKYHQVVLHFTSSFIESALSYELVKATAYADPIKNFECIVAKLETKWELFLHHFVPWEVEQIACVHDFLLQQLSELSLRCITSAKTYKERWNILNEKKLHPRNLLLHESTNCGENRYFGWRKKYMRLVPSKYLTDSCNEASVLNPDFGPYWVWKAAHQKSGGKKNRDFGYVAYSPQKSRKKLAMKLENWHFRYAAYVTWDLSRVENWAGGIRIFSKFPVPGIATLGDVEDEASSFRRRDKIFLAGGRGWWSKNDETKVVYPGPCYPYEYFGPESGLLIESEKFLAAPSRMNFPKTNTPRVIGITKIRDGSLGQVTGFRNRLDRFAPPHDAFQNPKVYPPYTHTTMAANALVNLPQAEVDAIIRTKRKAREPKACYPCHTRKVKCDRNLPCDGCVKRDHADLCSYERPSKKRHIVPQQPYAAPTIAQSNASIDNVPISDGAMQSAISGGGMVTVSRTEWETLRLKLKDMEQAMASMQSGMEREDMTNIPSIEAPPPELPRKAAGATIPEGEGIHATNEYGNGTVHLGSRSVLAYLLGGSSQEAAQALLEGGVLPKLGLDNETATYPFIDLWSSDSSTFDISAVATALPDDEQCRKLFGYYRNIASTIYPVLPDIHKFGEDLEILLQNRAMFGINANENLGLDKPFGMPIAYVGLLFAILAAGCQSSDMPGKERELTSQVYICCSYQFLRATNFMSQPTLDAIQTLLIIGNVLSYNMNPGVSYILLGMSLRMGLALGLQVETKRFSPAEQYARRRVWYDHLSQFLDTPSTMAFSHPDIPYHPDSQPGGRSFFETLCRIIALTLEIVRGRMISPHSPMGVSVIRSYKEEMKRILSDATTYLRDPKFCTTQTEHIEHLGLKLHSSYITSELCRPVLKMDADTKDPVILSLRKDCIAALARTVEAYIELHTTNPQVSRSWIGLQRAISCAFLLAIVGESKTDPQIWSLLRRLEFVLADRAAADETSDPGTTSSATNSTSTTLSPQLYNSSQKRSNMAPEPSSNVISGVTNIPMSSFEGPNLPSATIEAYIPTDTETQWAKPLVKSLRALQKLNAAITMHNRQHPPVTTMGGQLPPTTSPTMGAVTGLTPPAPFPVPIPGTTTRATSIPPPTPESSASGEWSFPTLLDRAQEYIHPPLWA